MKNISQRFFIIFIQIFDYGKLILDKVFFLTAAERRLKYLYITNVIYSDKGEIFCKTRNWGDYKMKKLPQISDAEFEVMNVIWKYAPSIQMILWTGCRRKVTGVRERFRRCYRGWKKRGR